MKQEKQEIEKGALRLFLTYGKIRMILEMEIKWKLNVNTWKK